MRFANRFDVDASPARALQCRILPNGFLHQFELKIGNIAGSYVLSGKINRKDKVRLIRDDVEIWSGVLSSLRRFKEDVREVSSGFECGLVFDGYRDPRVGDRIEAYEKYEVQRKLDAPA